MLKTFYKILLLLPLVSCGAEYLKDCNNLECSLKQDKQYSFKHLKKNNINYLLNNQEAGLYYFLKNDIDASLNYFNNAVMSYKQFKEANCLSKLNKNLISLSLSSTLTKYEGSDFEEALIYYYKGLSYLQKNDLNNALIEFRASEDIIKYSQEIRQKKIISAENNINKSLSQLNLESDYLNELLQQSREIRADTQNKFINGNITYISGIVKELNKQYNDALVNYKQAYNLLPNNTFIIKDLYRLSLQYDRDYAIYLAKTYPKLLNLNFRNYHNKNTVYVIYEQGFIPKRINFKLPLIYSENLMLSINLPVYNDNINSPNEVSMTAPKANINVIAEQTADIYKLSKNQLLEIYPIIISQQLIKLLMQLLPQQALQLHNVTAQFNVLLGSLYLLDTADLRSWYTLPNYVKIAKIDTEANFNNILLKINNDRFSLDIPSLQENNVILLYVFDSGGKLYTKVLYKGKK